MTQINWTRDFGRLKPATLHADRWDDETGARYRMSKARLKAAQSAAGKNTVSTGTSRPPDAPRPRLGTKNSASENCRKANNK